MNNNSRHLADYLAGLMARADAFPKADLIADDEAAASADALLSEVRQEIASRGDDILLYFDTSRPRYLVTLQLALGRPKGRALDMGCSPGHVGMALSKAGFDVFGVDLNTEYLKKYPPGWAEALKIKQVAFEQEPMPYPDNFFDVVVFTEVLEHIAVTSPTKIMLEIRRLLKPGGQLVLSTPNVANISNILALLKGQNIFWDPGIFYGGLDRHNREFTPHEVGTLMREAQFTSWQFAYVNTSANWNANADQDTYELLGSWKDANEVETNPLFKNTIFVRATK